MRLRHLISSALAFASGVTWPVPSRSKCAVICWKLHVTKARLRVQVMISLLAGLYALLRMLDCCWMEEDLGSAATLEGCWTRLQDGGCATEGRLEFAGWWLACFLLEPTKTGSRSSSSSSLIFNQKKWVSLEPLQKEWFRTISSRWNMKRISMNRLFNCCTMPNFFCTNSSLKRINTELSWSKCISEEYFAWFSCAWHVTFDLHSV